MDAPKLRRRWLFRIFVFLSVLVGLVLGAEIYLRFTASSIVDQDDRSFAGIELERSPAALKYHTKRGKRVRPNANAIIRNHRTSHRDIRLATNSLGYREPEISSEKQPGEIRILALGDSITLGDYLDAEEVYVHQAEVFLEKALPGQPIDVINAGVGDIGLREEIDILEETGLSVNPDILLIGFYLNDSRPPWGFPEELGHPGFFRRHSVLVDTVYHQLKLRAWVKETGEDRFRWIVMKDRLNWRHKRKALLKLANFARYDWGAAWMESSWSVISEECKRLQSLANHHSIPVVFAIFPVKFQVYCESLENTPQTRMAEIARSFGFSCLDLLPILRKHRLKPDLYFDQCHPTIEGNTIIGEAIADFLLREVLTL